MWYAGVFFFCCFLGRELGSPKATAWMPKSLPFLGKLCCQGKLVSNGMLTWGVKPPGCPFFLDVEKTIFYPFAHCTIPHLLAEVWCVCHGVCRHAWNRDPHTIMYASAFCPPEGCWQLGPDTFMVALYFVATPLLGVKLQELPGLGCPPGSSLLR